MRQAISTQLSESAQLLSLLAHDCAITQGIEDIATACIQALRTGNKLLFMGNGGSAADSQHLAAELISRFAYDRPGLPAFALTTDTSVLTAVGNDYGYDQLFQRQVEAVARPGDVLFGITTSGRSPNVLAGLVAGKRLGTVTVAFTGNRGGEITEICDHCIEIPSASTPRIQESHIVVGHIICGLIEQRMFEPKR